MVHQRVFSMSPLAELPRITRHGPALQEYKPLVIEMNKRGRNMPTESPKLLALPSVYSAGMQPLAGTAGLCSSVVQGWGPSAWLIGSGTAEERELSAWGAGMGTVPYGLLLPLPLPSLSLSFALSCANADASLMISRSPSFPSL